MIKNVIFDIGKVLVSYEPDEMMAGLGFTQEEIDAVDDALFENELWEQSDQGLFEPDEILAKAIANVPDMEQQIRLAWDNVGKTIERFPYVIDWIKSYKNRGYKVYILSNYAKHTLELTKEQLSFIPLMDGIVFSYECKLMKPMSEIYELILNKYSLKAEECIFVDDREENIKGAIDCGIKGIVFKNFEQAKEDMEALLK